MNFAALPPEVNSARMYTGAGPGPLLSAATAWNGLATELHVAASAYQSVVSELTSGPWTGPSSIAMAASITPFVTWLDTTSGQAAKTAVQAKSAVAAYEAAFALTVPPPVIAANRAQLMTLLATNILGQNAAAIAATEAQYAEMWAQDATAMYGYASTSATASELEPFQPPPQTANPAGPLHHGGSDAAANSAANNAQALASKAAATLAGPGSSEASPFPAMPVQADVPTGFFEWLGIAADEVGIGIALPLSIIGVYLAGAAMYFAEMDSREIFDTQDILRGGQQSIMDSLEQLGVTGELPGMENLRVPHASVVSALGESFPLGALSVPPNWAELAPEIRHASFATPLGAGASGASAAGLGTAFGQMALAGMGGSALAGAVNRNRGQDGKPTPAAEATPAPAAAGSPSQPQSEPVRPLAVPVAELASGIRQLGELHDAGYLTAEEFAEQKQRLLSR